MKQTRKEFLRNIAVISAANLMLPSWLRAKPYDSIQVYFPELEGTTFNGSLVQVLDAGTGVELGRGTTTNSQATISFVPTGVKDNNDNSQLLTKMNTQDIGGVVLVSYPVHSESKVVIGLYDILGRQIWEKSSYQSGGNHSYEFKINELASGRYILRVTTNDYTGTMMLPIVDHGLGLSQNISPSQTIVNSKSGKKIDGLDKINSGDYKIVVSSPLKEHYTRTAYTSPVTTFSDKVTGYVQQQEVSPDLFRSLAAQVNFRSMVGVRNVLGCGYEGMKTYLQKQNKRIWIAFEDPNHSHIQSQENQAYIKNLIIQKIYPTISEPNWPSIHMVDPAQPEDVPNDWDGRIYVMPFVYTYYNWAIISQDVLTSKSSEGFIDTAQLFFGGGDNFGNGSTWADPTYDQKKITLFMRSLCAPADTSDPAFNNLTVLSTNAPTQEFSAMDKKLIKIAEYYKPKSPIDEILGL